MILNELKIFKIMTNTLYNSNKKKFLSANSWTNQLSKFLFDPETRKKGRIRIRNTAITKAVVLL